MIKIYSKIFTIAMLAFLRGSSSSFGRFFAGAVKTLEERCDEVFRKVIEPVLEAEGTDVIFHGLQDDCAVITLDGNASTVTKLLDDKDLPKEILEIIQQHVPEVKAIRQKQIWED